MRRPLFRNGRGQTAAFDAILTIIILMIASAAVYAGVVNSIKETSGSRTATELRETAEAGTDAALAAATPEVTYIEPGTGQLKHSVNVSGTDLVRMIQQLRGTGAGYDTSDLELLLLELFELAFFGRPFAVSITGEGLELLLSGEDIRNGSDIPHPRTVVTREILSGDQTLALDLYIW